MALPIIPILKFIAVQVLVPIAIEKAPVFIDKVRSKMKDHKNGKTSSTLSDHSKKIHPDSEQQ